VQPHRRAVHTRVILAPRLLDAPRARERVDLRAHVRHNQAQQSHVARGARRREELRRELREGGEPARERFRARVWVAVRCMVGAVEGGFGAAAVGVPDDDDWMRTVLLVSL
jgi:hypothetical protein